MDYNVYEDLVMDLGYLKKDKLGITQIIPMMLNIFYIQVISRKDQNYVSQFSVAFLLSVALILKKHRFLLQTIVF